MVMMDRRQVAVLDQVRVAARRRAQPLWAWARGPGRQLATALALSSLRQIRWNLTPRRLLSFPHALVLIWMVILLWGERWVFESKVGDCAWRNWERWPKGATPHHLILVADPQIIDAHSYPGRSWPLTALTMLITDNYLRRGYTALQRHLRPDSLFFLGDLFDGGREWKTRLGTFADPKWGIERPDDEKRWVKTWHRRYGEDYWLREYQRFARIFIDTWSLGGDAPGPWQQGRKLVASLPGNHDLGFGAQVQVPVRDRFAAFFGDVNRVDVIGNHTIVSVDTVSLSAETSLFQEGHDVRPIHEPVDKFLGGVQAAKRRAVQQELSAWYGGEQRPRFSHRVEELDKAEAAPNPGADPGAGGPELPTILLTHVPLYREPETPCGPRREHWPPTKPAKGQTGPVVPDDRNAITVEAGYQYQNVLNEADSVKLIKSIGNVVHVFSGDDHDYCEVVHSRSKANVREITVKSFSMVMGVRTPGFLMVSLFNPVGGDGQPVGGAPETTLQTRLCLLPNQFHTYMLYVTFILLTAVVLAVRALLVPVLRLEPFAQEPEWAALPLFKDKAKADPPADYSGHWRPSGAAASGAVGASNGAARWAAKKSRQGRRWGWTGDEGGPRIKLDDDFYDGGKGWKADRGRRVLGTLGRELWATSWRVAWMAGLFWAYLARGGEMRASRLY